MLTEGEHVFHILTADASTVGSTLEGAYSMLITVSHLVYVHTLSVRSAS